MEYHRHEIRAGMILVGAVVILLTLLFFSSDFSSWFRATRVTLVTFKNAGGLAKYDPAVFKGVKVGKVTDMKVLTDEGNLVLVTLEVNADLPIYRRVPGGSPGTEFKIIPTGLLGESAIEILAGDPRNPRVEPGERVEGREVVRLDELTAMVEDIATNVRDAMATLTKTVNDPEIQAKFRETLDSLSRTSVNLDQMVGGNTQNVNAILGNFEKVSADLSKTSQNMKELSAELKGIMAENRAQIKTLVDNYQKMPKNIEGDFNRVEKSITGMIEENRKELQSLIDNLDQTAQHLEAASKKIETDPSLLIRRSDRKETPPSP